MFAAGKFQIESKEIMGSSFSNVHVYIKGGDLESISQTLRKTLKPPACFYSCSSWTSVFSEAIDEQDWNLIVGICKSLSSDFNTSVVGSLVHDSDLLNVVLAVTGEVMGVYDSNPGFGFDEDLPPIGGDVGLLNQLFNTSCNDEELQSVLRSKSENEFLFADARWVRLANCIGIHNDYLCETYESISNDKLIFLRMSHLST